MYFRSAYSRIWYRNLRPAHTAEPARQLERVQQRFFRLASYVLSLACPPRDYRPAASFLGLVSLAERKRFFGNKFLKGLVSGDVDFPTLLSLISFNVLLVLFLRFTFFSVSLITRVMNPLDVKCLTPMRTPLIIFNCYALFETDVYVLCLCFCIFILFI